MPQQPASTEFLDALSLGIRELSLSTARVLVAVSGGADSVALLRGLHALSNNLPLTCVAAHINHGLRGAESDQDAAWVSELAKQLGVEVYLRSADLNLDVSSGKSLEEAARNRRYALLTEIAVAANCGAVAVAHTADDQTETVLHHLIRGTGIAGLAGIPKSRSLSDRIQLIRPLLSVRRELVEQWLRDIGQDYRTDASNIDRRFTRNRIRHDLLPLLEQQFNSAFRQVLASLSEQAAETSAFLRRHAEDLADDVLQSSGPETIRVDCLPLQSLDRVLIREVLRVIWGRAGWPLKRMGFREWQRLADLTFDGVAFNLPDRIDARRRGALLILSKPSTPADGHANDE
ncbi:MAG: tRNA lysidine(34) synthetase TilS [Planctomycetota bacterium]|jgi:tRNA(Ile)-lysidine synthase